MAHSVAAYVLAARGELDDGRRHVAAAEQAVAATGSIAATLWLITATARLALAAGADDAVVDALLPLAGVLRGAGLPEGVQPWRADLVVALVKQGRLDDAERELAELRDRVQAGGAHARAGTGPRRRHGRGGSGRRRCGGDCLRRRARRRSGVVGPVRSRPAGARRRGLRASPGQPADGRRDSSTTPSIDSSGSARRRSSPQRSRNGVPAPSMPRDRSDARGLTKAEAAVAALVAEGRHEPRGRGVPRRQREDRRVSPRPHLRQDGRAVPDGAGHRMAGRRGRRLIRRLSDRDPELGARREFGDPPDDVAEPAIRTLPPCGW